MIDKMFTDSAAGVYEGRDIKRGNFVKPVLGLHVDKSSLANIMDCAKILPFAAEAFNISPDLGDYIVTPVEIIRSEIPNRNGTGFLYEELTRYNPMRGDLSYRTWKGMGAYVEHANNRDPDQAAGLILDVSIRRAPEFVGSFYRLNHLVAFDRNKRPDIATEILERKRTGYSMGSLCNYYSCSYCNRNVSDMGGYCEHIDTRTSQSKAMSMKIINGKLAYSQPRGISGIEASSVMIPAASFARNGNYLMTPRDKK
jgi:hypothetical protein